MKNENDKKELDMLIIERAFNNESTQWTFRLSMLMIGFLGLGILYAGIIIWILNRLVGL